MKRYAAKIDNNQNEIVKALRKMPGVSVELDHNDILVGYQGKTYWYEIKNPDEIDKKGVPYKFEKQLGQKRLLENFKGHYRIVWSIDQILDELVGTQAHSRE